MRRFLAMLADSLREALDRKLLVLLLVLTSLPVLFCLSISFEREPVEETLRGVASRLNRFPRYGPRGHRMWRRIEAHVDVAAVTPIAGGDSWPEEVRGGHVVDLTFTEPNELDKLFWFVQDVKDNIVPRRRRGDAADEARAPATTAEKVALLEDRFRAFGFNRVVVRKPEDAAERYLVAANADYPLEVRGGHRLSLLFGGFSGIPLPLISIAEFTIRLQQGLCGIFAGYIVMIVIVQATAGFVPSMLGKGTLDLLLARPVGRIRLLLWKYVGGLWFIALFAVLLVGGCAVSLGIRTGFFNPWFLFPAVTLVAIFAVLYAVSVLVGVLTRSAGAAALVALGVWGLSTIVVEIRHTMKMLLWGADLPGWFVTLVDVSYLVLPKTNDLIALNTYALSRSNLSPDMYARTFGTALPPIDWAYSLGSTGLFVALMLGLACWRFWRRDY